MYESLGQQRKITPWPSEGIRQCHRPAFHPSKPGFAEQKHIGCRSIGLQIKAALTAFAPHL